MKLVVTFQVVGLPQPQGSTTTFVREGRALTTSANKKLRPWRDDVRAAAKAAKDTAGFDTLNGAVHVTADFKFLRLKGHYGKHGLLASAPRYKTTSPDVDKLLRAVLDSLTDSGVIRDDSIVVSSLPRKGWDTWNGVNVKVFEMEADDDIDILADYAAA